MSALEPTGEDDTTGADDAIPGVHLRPPVSLIRFLYACVAGMALVGLFVTIFGEGVSWGILALVILMAGVAYTFGVQMVHVDDDGVAGRDWTGRAKWFGWTEVQGVRLPPRGMQTGFLPQDRVVVVGRDEQQIPAGVPGPARQNKRTARIVAAQATRRDIPVLRDPSS